MTVLNAANVPAPTLPKETAEVASLGGEVVVCGLKLTDRLAVQKRMSELREADDAAAMRFMVPELLALSVVGAEGTPLFTIAQWETFGASHQGEALNLFAIAMRLSGFSREEDRKN